MKKNIYRHAVSFIHAQSPWTKEKNKAYVQLSIRFVL
jgi:hypothetical protein